MLGFSPPADPPLASLGLAKNGSLSDAGAHLVAREDAARQVTPTVFL